VSIPVVVAAPQDGVMSRKKGPRSDGPRPRRSFTPARKLDLLTRYEQAVAAGRLCDPRARHRDHAAVQPEAHLPGWRPKRLTGHGMLC